MKILSILAFLIIAGSSLPGQNLIGYKPEEIRKFMHLNRKEMNEEEVNNTLYKYLKYSDNRGDQTILFFLSPDSVCHSVRMICNKSLKSEKIKELDSTYIKDGENSWIEKQSSMNYIVSLTEDDWSFSITIKTKK